MKLLPDTDPAGTRSRVLDLTDRAPRFVIGVSGQRLRTRDGALWDTHGEEAKFVMGEDCVVYGSVKFREQGKSLHHSSFLREPVAAAGLAVAEAGVLKYLICDSGHYQPTPQHMAQFLRHLSAAGAPLAGVRVGFHGTAGDDFVWIKAEDCLELEEDADLERYGVAGPDRTGKKDKASLSRSTTASRRSSTALSRSSTYSNVSVISGQAARNQNESIS